MKSPKLKVNFFVKMRRRDKSISDEFQICLLLQTACNTIIWVFVSLQNVIFPPFIIITFITIKIEIEISNWKSSFLTHWDAGVRALSCFNLPFIQPAYYMIICFFVSLQNFIFPPFTINMVNINIIDLSVTEKSKWLPLYFPWYFTG